MSRDYFRIMLADLTTGKGRIVKVDGRETVAGGSGLAALLFNKYGHVDRPWNDPEQPLIFAIGPLTGCFPLMSKTVSAFKSPYHDQYTESHAGGRSALAIKFADIDALVITGRSDTPCCLALSSRRFEVRDVSFMWGMDVFQAGPLLRDMFSGSGHRTMLRIGPAGENGSAMACINVDTYRHFGRLGAGAVMGSKNLKAIVIHGDAIFKVPEDSGYKKLFDRIYKEITSTDMMKKYHNLGTPANLKVLNDIKSLPWRNLQATSDAAIGGITGERFAADTLLRNSACSGCPVGCIHVGFVREKFMKDNRYLYKQISYDYELIFSLGSMLGVTDAFEVLNILDVVDRCGLDGMSAGVCLSWATEAVEKGIISEKETIVSLRFGDSANYREAVRLLAAGENEFYRLLAQGSMKAAQQYGGAEFACVLGQEMAGYATGEVFFAAQSLGFRHSHLDAGGYSYDQKHREQDVEKAVDFLVKDEAARTLITSMVACLFARGIYKSELLAECLRSAGYANLAQNLDTLGTHIQKFRWQTRFATGFNPEAIEIPKRFFKIKTWKGPIDPEYLIALKQTYGQRIIRLAAGGGDGPSVPVIP